jgi:outer membrane protein OmpA-like peptidoglycan-associated protein
LEDEVEVREIIGLVSITIGILLFGVSFYLFLRRNRTLPQTQLRRSAVVTLIYGLFFCILGFVIERTTPAFHEADTAQVLQDTARIMSPKIVKPTVDSAKIEREEIQPTVAEIAQEESKPAAKTKTVDTPDTVKHRPAPKELRIAKKEMVPVRGTMERKQYVPWKKTAMETDDMRPKPLEDEIYETVDELLSRIEAFFDRYAFPVAVESYSPPALMFRPIFFSDTTADIPSKYFYLLNETARLMKQHSEIGAVEIRSYTDGEGPEVYNYLITQSRANSARDYLISQGVEPERLVARGYGAARPPEVGINSGKLYSHRRIEFVPLALDQTSRTR